MYFVYLLASGRDGTLYLGVTNDLVRRVYEHKAKLVQGFSSRYNIARLVWFEVYDDPASAIAREKDIKKVAPLVESPIDRSCQSRLERSLRRNLALTPLGFRARRASRGAPE